MRQAITAATLAFLAVTATPAAAQIVGRSEYGDVGTSNPFLPDGQLPGPSVAGDVRHLRGSIERAREQGLISAREARRLDRQARHIAHLGRRYGGDGLSHAERDELATRARLLREFLANRPRG